jgi:hypothetical protein
MSPSYEIQVAVVARLKSNAAVNALISGRVYDSVPKTAQFPYVTLGEGDENAADADCIDGLEISFDVDVWSRSVGFPESKHIADAVRRALTNPEIVLQENALVDLTHRQTRVFRDPDGLTSHAVLTFQAFVEQP